MERRDEMRIFTQQELDTLSDDGLRRLADYANIKLRRNANRKSIIKRLVVEFVYPSAVELEAENPTGNISVRIARIRKQFLEEK